MRVTLFASHLCHHEIFCDVRSAQYVKSFCWKPAEWGWRNATVWHIFCFSHVRFLSLWEMCNVKRARRRLYTAAILQQVRCLPWNSRNTSHQLPLNCKYTNRTRLSDMKLVEIVVQLNPRYNLISFFHFFVYVLYTVFETKEKTKFWNTSQKSFLRLYNVLDLIWPIKKTHVSGYRNLLTLDLCFIFSFKRS